MNDPLEIEGGEYVDYLDLQYSVYRSIQDRARNVFVMIIAGLTALGTLASVGVIKLEYFRLNTSPQFSPFFGGEFPLAYGALLESIGSVLGGSLYVLISMLVISGCWRLFRILARTDINPPFQNGGGKFLIVEDNCSNTRQREKILSNNQKTLDKMASQYSTATSLGAFAIMAGTMVMTLLSALYTESSWLLFFSFAYPHLLFFAGLKSYPIKHPLKTYKLYKLAMESFFSEVPETNRMFLDMWIKGCYVLTILGILVGVTAHIHIFYLG